MEDHQESDEHVDGIRVDSDGVVHRIILVGGFSVMDHFLHSVKSQASCENQPSVKPNVPERFTLRVKDTQEGDCKHAATADCQSTTPHEVLL